MMVLITSLMAIFILFFNTLVYAKKYNAELCHDSMQYYCYTVKNGETWKTLFPNDAQRDLVMRINRINIQIHPGFVLAIPKSQETHMLDYSPLPTQINPPGEKLIYVSLGQHAFGAYNSNGAMEYWGPVSGGRGYCPDIGRGCHTPLGRYMIQSKGGGGCYSTKFPVGRGGAPMPYCMFFHGGYALHGSYEVPGYNASHGCVRLFVNDARWLNQDFDADKDTRVIIAE